MLGCTLCCATEITMLTVERRCPLNCDDKITSHSRPVSGHKGRVRMDILIKILEVIDTPGGREEAIKLITQQDSSRT